MINSCELGGLHCYKACRVCGVPSRYDAAVVSRGLCDDSKCNEAWQRRLEVESAQDTERKRK